MEVGSVIGFDQSDTTFDNTVDQEDIFAGGGTVIFRANLVDGGDLGFGRILTQGSAASAFGAWNLFVGSSGLLVFQVATDGSTGEWQTPTSSVSFGVPHEFAVTYDKDNLTTDPLMYVDAVSETVSEASTPTGTALSPDEIILMGGITGLDRQMDGELGNVRLYNRVLTPTQITQSFQGRGTDGLVAGRVRQWFMGELAPGVAVTVGSIRGLTGNPNTAINAGAELGYVANAGLTRYRGMGAI